MKLTKSKLKQIIKEEWAAAPTGKDPGKMVRSAPNTASKGGPSRHYGGRGLQDLSGNVIDAADNRVQMADELAAKHKTVKALDDALVALARHVGGQLDSSQSRTTLEKRDALILAKEIVESDRLETVADQLAMKYKTKGKLRRAYGETAQAFDRANTGYGGVDRFFGGHDLKSATGGRLHGGLEDAEAYQLLFRLWALDRAKEKLKAGFGDEMKKAGMGIGAKWNEGVNMKLTKSKLKQIIKEELAKALSEGVEANDPGDGIYKRKDGTCWEERYGYGGEVPCPEHLSDEAVKAREEKAAAAADPTGVGAKIATGLAKVSRPTSLRQEKLTKSKLKQIVQEELEAMLTLEMFSTSSAGTGPQSSPQLKPHVVSSRGFSRGPVEHDGEVVDDNNGKGWDSPQDALNATTESGAMKRLEQKYPNGILYPEIDASGKAVIYFLPTR